MIRALQLQDVGPARKLNFEFAPRLNILTGDNGLGKSFVLDVAWWALTGHWSGEKAFPWRPQRGGESSDLDPQIWATVAPDHDAEPAVISASFQWRTQEWKVRSVHPATLVVYARIDGGFAVWDAYQTDHEDHEDPTGVAALLKPNEVWGGKHVEAADGQQRVVCRGLLEDWLTWQGTRASEFATLAQVLSLLSDPDEPLVPGPPTRVHLNNKRDIPTLEMPYGTVPVTLASAGQRRVLALAYILVWTWAEHRKAAAVTHQEPSPSMVFLLDEAEMHLHPRWQRVLLPAVLRAIKAISPEISVQLVTATHAPLVLASIEPYFDEDLDNLYRFELHGPNIEVHNLKFAKQGDVENWLVSETFGLTLARSIPSEAAIQAASDFMHGDTASAEAALKKAVESLDSSPFDPSADLKTRIHATLCLLLPGHDDFWPRWIVSYERSAAPHQE